MANGPLPLGTLVTIKEPPEYDTALPKFAQSVWAVGKLKVIGIVVRQDRTLAEVEHPGFYIDLPDGSGKTFLSSMVIAWDWLEPV
jgi:hypothetical protein